ncbi:hypothetical protein [uncultured Bacteroides sp.]|uniref:hypothetical protein n=1 Tax=uncultured Bacteroides sp. TaxID=162156 RepID=UPI002AA7DE87|nr:hypothetical protein [uncultured Bacteroides sp.]
MNKIKIFSFLAALLLLASCDYNDKYFDGYDDITVTDVAKYEGAYTGNYPAEGYFTSKTSLETSVNTMLKDLYEYCDKGSTAKVSVLYGDITKGFTTVTPIDSYTLVADDYDAMGTDAGYPGKYNNFDATMDVNAYLSAFCATKYPDAAIDDIVSITYKYYAGTTSDVSAYYQKTSAGWEKYEVEAFATNLSYTLVTEDYDAMGTESGTPGKYNNFDATMDIDHYLTIFLKGKYPYAAKDATCSVSYIYYASSVSSTQSRIYKYDGSSWAAFDPYADTVEITTKIAEMTYDGSNWTLVRLLGGSVNYTFAATDYQLLYNWVKDNKSAYLSTQYPDKEEYYFGSSTSYSNINNNYNTWRSYYDVEGTYVGKTNDEMQAIMDDRIAEGISTILLPNWVSTPDPGISYVVTYNVYSGRGTGNYVMSFMYNTETAAYELTAGPVAK